MSRDYVPARVNSSAGLVAAERLVQAVVRGTIATVSADPLKSALEEIAPKLDPELEPVIAALQADEPVEDAWETLLQEILDEA